MLQLRAPQIVVVFVFLVVILSGVALASSDCNFCHSVVFDTSDGNYCVQCHASMTNVNNGRAGSFPYVYSHSTDLAGGNFYHVASKGNRYGHNVAGFGDIPRDSINAPGINNNSLDFRATQLTCAGKYGCHGDRQWVSPREAMGNAHHDYDPAQSRNGLSVATSYRFLLGVAGREMNDDGSKWEFSVSSSKHNEYQGSGSTLDPKSISYLCGQCHGSDAIGNSTGNFHGRSGTGSGSPWKRHPTDMVIPTGEFAGYTIYNPAVPVARINVNAVTDPSLVNVYSRNEVIMCLSCHRAHGSPYPSILRFEYGEHTSATNGCLTCHTKH